jgi:osmotically-inducible protein OsmY
MNSIKRVPALFLGAALSIFLVSASAQAQSPSTQSQDRPGDYVSDALITSKIKVALFEDSLVRATEVNVETTRGAVQLSGFVSSEAAIAQAVRLARDIKGVVTVHNDMRVK